VAVASHTEKARMRKDDPHADDKRMELTEHLGELRSRIMRIILYAVIGTIVSYYKFKPIFNFLNEPFLRGLKNSPVKVVWAFTDVMTAFFVVLQISVVAGIILTAPLIILEIYGFIAPALTRQEKRPLLYVAPLSVVLFAGGVALAYWVAPLAVSWFIDYVALFGPNTVLNQDPQKWVLFMLKMMGIFGAVFQLPIMLMFLAWIGILRSAGMKRTWRHAIVAISVLGLIVTPTNDWFTMLAMIIPVILLYLGSIFLVQLIERKRERDQRKRFGDD
jgi:sec-independent protein translocase protein TatC